MKKLIIVVTIISIALCLCSCDPYADEREEANKRIRGLENCAKGEHEYVDLTEEKGAEYCSYIECKWCKDTHSVTHVFQTQSDTTRHQHHIKCSRCGYEYTEDHVGRGEDTTEVVDRTKQPSMVSGRIYAYGSYWHVDITGVSHIVDASDGTCDICHWGISHYAVSNVSTYDLDSFRAPATKCTINGLNAIKLTHAIHDFIDCDIKAIYIVDCNMELRNDFTFDVALLYVETTDGWYDNSGTLMETAPTVVLGDTYF